MDAGKYSTAALETSISVFIALHPGPELHYYMFHLFLTSDTLLLLTLITCNCTQREGEGRGVGRTERKVEQREEDRYIKLFDFALITLLSIIYLFICLLIEDL